MKIQYLLLLVGGLSLVSCVDLDLNPLSNAPMGTGIRQNSKLRCLLIIFTR